MSSGILANTAELRKIILENPNLPIAVLCDADLFIDECTSMFAARVTFSIGEILDYPQEIRPNRIYYDRIAFEEDLADMLADRYEGISQKAFEHRVKTEMKCYEMFWKPCILIYATV